MTRERNARLSSPRITLEKLVEEYKAHNDEFAKSLSESEKRIADRITRPSIPAPPKMPTRVGR